MSSTLDRLRRLQHLREQRKRAEPPRPVQPSAQLPDPDASRADLAVALDRGRSGRLDDLVPGQVLENSGGLYYQTTFAIPLHERRGSRALGDLLQQQPAALAPFHPDFGLTPAVDFRRAAFIDTETTGLGAGASVYCFMVGIGAFAPCDAGAGEPTHFVVRQLFMRNPAEEGALLMALTDLLQPYTMTVTFNGRGFDLPLLRARYRYNRHVLPATGHGSSLLHPDQPHLDLLPPARRLWRRRLQSCRLINLEQSILNLQRTEADVPGHLIPQLYSDYLRSGDAGELSRVFYHNREDIVSMVALAEQLSRTFGRESAPQEADEVPGLDWLSLGRCYEQLGRLVDAETAYRHALAAVTSPVQRADAFALLGQLQKRQDLWSAAVETWQLWLSSVPGDDPTPFVELAKHFEWRARDLEQAEMWTGWALHNLRRSADPAQWHAQILELEHRLARVRRKRSGAEAAASAGGESPEV